MEGNNSIRLDRLDLTVFIGAFLIGLILYFTLHFFLNMSQIIVSTAIVTVMIAYAFLILRVPRLRVRLDQAGDNAYYLGLLFTLISMASALYNFGEVQGGTGTRQIIANFGIALSSTIAGIFLRVSLHQVRVDPAEVEGMTRVELAEASKRVRASLDTLTIDLGHFHEGVRQRSSDVIVALIEDGKKTANSINQNLEETTKEMLASVGNIHKEILNQTQELTRLIEGTATEATKAIDRLRSVEPPPLVLSLRLDMVTEALKSVGDQTERFASNLQGTANSAESMMEKISKASSTLQNFAQQIEEHHTEAMQALASSVQAVSVSLDSVGQRLEQEWKLSNQLEEQSRRSAEESMRAQKAANEVLTRLTELTRGLAVILKPRRMDDENGNAK